MKTLFEAMALLLILALCGASIPPVAEGGLLGPEMAMKTQ